MRSTIRTLLLILALIFLALCDNDEQDPNVNIPDDNFLIALIDLGVDTNGDGKISSEEALIVDNLDISYKNISDLTGIENFENLDTLICIANQLTELDISKNTSLISLICSENQLSVLNISENTILKELWCSENVLLNLNVSNNQMLKELYCHDNQIRNLDLSKNGLIEWLVCDKNLITELDVSYNTLLIELSCRHNALKNLDISNNSDLAILICQNTQITGLDVSNNTNLHYLYINEMTFLQQVCVWEMPFPPAGVYIDTTNSPNVYFTTDCK